MRLVLHSGGDRAGELDWIEEAELTSLLVYSGPRHLGVYRKQTPESRVQTAQGPAEVWLAVQ